MTINRRSFLWGIPAAAVAAPVAVAALAKAEPVRAAALPVGLRPSFPVVDHGYTHGLVDPGHTHSFTHGHNHGPWPAGPHSHGIDHSAAQAEFNRRMSAWINRV